MKYKGNSSLYNRLISSENP